MISNGRLFSLHHYSAARCMECTNGVRVSMNAVRTTLLRSIGNEEERRRRGEI